MLPARRQGVPLLRAIRTSKGRLFSPAGTLTPPTTAAGFADGSCAQASSPAMASSSAANQVSATVPSCSLAPGRCSLAASPTLAARQYPTYSPVRTSADLSRQGNGSTQLESQTITYMHGMFDDYIDPMSRPESTPFEFASKFVLLEKVKLIGDKVEKDYPVLTNAGKVLFGSLFLIIEKLRRHGYSFQQPVSVAQLMVNRWGLFVVKDGTVLQKTSERAVSHDYVSSAIVFEVLIRYSCGDATDNIPGDFKELLRILRRKSGTHLGYFASVHPSLVRLGLEWSAYMDVYHYVKDKLSDDSARRITAGLKRCISRWDEVAFGNTLLGTWYRQGDNNRGFRDCPEDMLTFLRNVHLNPLVYMELYGREFTQDDVMLLVRCKFPKFMPTLYWELWKEGLLTEIKTEHYFCLFNGGSPCCPKLGSCLRRELRLMKKPIGANSPSVETSMP